MSLNSPLKPETGGENENDSKTKEEEKKIQAAITWCLQ